MQVLAISGSLRKKSSNTLLILAAQSLALPDIEIKLFEGLGDLPYFNPDLDSDELPFVVFRFRQEIARSDAILISTPEYAHGIPGVLKNALDWLVSDALFAGKPVGIIMGSASDGSFALTALIEVLNTMSAKVVREAVVCIPGLRTKFDANGNLVDTKANEDIRQVLQELVGRK